VIDSEVIVVGGGPAGSACARELVRNNIETVVLEKAEAESPGGKICAGWITPQVLRDLGLRPKEYPHSLLTFNRLHYRIRRKRFSVMTRQYSIRRCEFDPWLLVRAGAPVHRHAVSRIREEDGRYIIDDLFRAKYLVGAGGTDCPVYRTLFAKVNPRARELLIIGMDEEFPYEYRNKNCYLWFFDRDLPGYSWYVPKGNGYLNIGLGGKFAALKGGNETLRDHWDYFIQKLDGLSLVKNHASHPRGRNYYLRHGVDAGRLGNAFITGDAAGLATVDMGEGIGPAVESGILAAESIIHGIPYSLKSVTKYSWPGILFPWWNRRFGRGR